MDYESDSSILDGLGETIATEVAATYFPRGVERIQFFSWKYEGGSSYKTGPGSWYLKEVPEKMQYQQGPCFFGFQLRVKFHYRPHDAVLTSIGAHPLSIETPKEILETFRILVQDQE